MAMIKLERTLYHLMTPNTLPLGLRGSANHTLRLTSTTRL